MDESAFRNGQRQKHRATFSVDRYGSVVCDALCEIRKVWPGDEAPQSEKLEKGRKINVEFRKCEFPSIATSFRSYKIVAARALQNLEYGEELRADYGDNYESC